MSIVFGAIPSRRLGRSLGINNIPYKYCTYSCVYCQLGATNSMTTIIRDFFSPGAVFEETKQKLYELESAGELVDYITFVPDGEPTLDINLGVMIEKLKSLGKPVAVITNSSLINDKNIRNELMLADWVSLKIDSASPSIWEKINRPHGSLRLNKIINGLIKFASEFSGELVTETMLVKNINTSFGSLRKTAEVISKINPSTAYIIVPTRPPAESFVQAPDEERINAAYQIFSEFKINAELLTHYEGAEFSYTHDVQKELLSILAVHPMRIDAVKVLLNKANSGWEIIDNLIKKNLIKESTYSNNSFIIRKY
ncbi:MAG: radical SAM protein [Bacteroidetes bacterium]|nr:radical SAM protein [Bacteroidota bacterium]